VQVSQKVRNRLYNGRVLCTKEDVSDELGPQTLEVDDLEVSPLVGPEQLVRVVQILQKEVDELELLGLQCVETDLAAEDLIEDFFLEFDVEAGVDLLLAETVLHRTEVEELMQILLLGAREDLPEL